MPYVETVRIAYVKSHDTASGVAQGEDNKIIAVKTPSTPANFSAVVIGASVAAYYQGMLNILTGHMGEASSTQIMLLLVVVCLMLVKVTLNKRTKWKFNNSGNKNNCTHWRSNLEKP
ncbi:MAG: hypothetical protein LBP35_04555 [Candidatus Ancillula trichonymphae]|nr:hypothetical protein [Candidatus Ancillula trichonymphae]